MRSYSLFLLILLVFLVCQPASAQEQACSDAELAQTLVMVPHLGTSRTKTMYACSIYAHELQGTDQSLADLPPLAGPELMLALTDGDRRNGELYGVSVTYPDIVGKQTVRLMIEVPPCARYSGMVPAKLPRMDVSVYYGQVEVSADMAAKLCQSAAAWCADCN